MKIFRRFRNKLGMTLAALFAAFAIAFTFAACDNGSGSGTPATAETAAENSETTDSNGTTTTDPTTDPADSANPSDDDDTANTGSGETHGGIETPTTPATYIGTKKPSEAKAVGDIVFSDGSATPYTEDLTLTAEQKAAAIAVIFYVGTDCSNDGTSRTLGVGLAQSHADDFVTDPSTHIGLGGIPWSTGNANACSKNIITIQCAASGSTGALTFTGDKDGSDNLLQIGTFLKDNGSSDDTSDSSKYPAFHYAKNYASQAGSHVSGTDYANAWYLPSFAELFYVWVKP